MAVVAATLLAGACSHEDPMAGEIACQQRMVAIPSAQDVAARSRRPQTMPAAFEAISRRYAAMDLTGCTDKQRSQIRMLVRHTHALATLAARLPEGKPPQRLGPATPAFMEFVATLENFENRRKAMQQDLDRMRAVR